MKQSNFKSWITVLLAAGTLGLTSGFDQYLHMRICHQHSRCQTDSHEDSPSDHSDTDQQHCPVCQFFTCGQNQTITCDYAEPVTEPVAAIQDKLENTSVYLTADLACKISRAPPAV
jgi:hypothetical protein